MRKIVFFMFFLSFILYAREDISKYKVEYTYYTPSDYKIAKDTLQSYLLFNDNESLYKIAKKRFDPNTIDYNENDELVGDIIDFEDEVYKNWERDLMLSYSPIAYQMRKTLKQPLDDFSILSIDDTKTKKILGYDCKHARIKYKYRIYDVYFTPEIKTHFGPWKFHGLEGLILEVKEKDGALAIQAKGIQKEKEKIITKLKPEEAQTWGVTLEKANIYYSQNRQELMRCCSDNPQISTHNVLEVYELNPELAYKITYEVYNTFTEKNVTDKSLITEFTLTTSPYESLYVYVEKIINTQRKSYSYTGGGKPYYKNLTDSITLQEKDKGKYYLVKGKLSLLKWKITKEEKEILGYKVRKAVTKKGDYEIVAWYAPQLPIPNGPSSYSYLPGLILSVEETLIGEDWEEATYYTATKIERIKEFKIKKPSKGKEISREEYDEIEEEYYRRQMEMYGGGVETDD